MQRAVDSIQAPLPHFLFFCHARNVGNECADSAASLFMRGFVSDSNVPSFLPERRFCVQHLFEIPHCLTQIAEVAQAGKLGSGVTFNFFRFFVVVFLCLFSVDM